VKLSIRLEPPDGDPTAVAVERDSHGSVLRGHVVARETRSTIDEAIEAAKTTALRELGATITDVEFELLSEQAYDLLDTLEANDDEAVELDGQGRAIKAPRRMGHPLG
jgi:hypothetical protein